MIVTIGSQKGGVGKSTLTVAIASYLIKISCKVLIIDADDQKSIINWYNARDEKLTHIPVTGATGNLKNMLSEHNKFYDFILVDCPGRDCQELRTSLLTSDLFLTPLKPSQMDIDALTHTHKTFLKALDFNEKLKCLAVLNMIPTSPFDDEAENAKQVLNDYENVQISSISICDRKSHRIAWTNAKTIFEMPTNTNKPNVVSTQKAQEEIRLLAEEILKCKNN